MACSLCCICLYPLSNNTLYLYFIVTSPLRRSYAITAVCLSFCEQDNSRTRSRMSTKHKHGRHGHWVRCERWARSRCGSIDQFLIFLNIGRWTFYICSLTRGRHCSGLGGVCALYEYSCSFCYLIFEAIKLLRGSIRWYRTICAAIRRR